MKAVENLASLFLTSSHRLRTNDTHIIFPGINPVIDSHDCSTPSPGPLDLGSLVWCLGLRAVPRPRVKSAANRNPSHGVVQEREAASHECGPQQQAGRAKKLQADQLPQPVRQGWAGRSQIPPGALREGMTREVG